MFQILLQMVALYVSIKRATHIIPQFRVFAGLLAPDTLRGHVHSPLYALHIAFESARTSRTSEAVDAVVNPKIHTDAPSVESA